MEARCPTTSLQGRQAFAAPLTRGLLTQCFCVPSNVDPLCKAAECWSRYRSVLNFPWRAIRHRCRCNVVPWSDEDPPVVAELASRSGAGSASTLPLQSVCVLLWLPCRVIGPRQAMMCTRPTSSTSAGHWVSHRTSKTSVEVVAWHPKSTGCASVVVTGDPSENNIWCFVRHEIAAIFLACTKKERKRG